MSSSNLIEFTRRQLWLKSIPRFWKGRFPCQQKQNGGMCGKGEGREGCSMGAKTDLTHTLASRWLENLNICLASENEPSSGAGFPVG